MGGYGSAFAVGIAGMMALSAIALITCGLMSAVELATEGYVAVANRLESINNERIEVLNASITGPRTVEAEVSNVGSTSIPAKDFGKVDVILIYTEAGGGSRAVWLPFDQTAQSEEGWRVVNVTLASGAPEVLNPVSLPDASSGQWDPDEVLTIEAWVSAQRLIDTSQPAYVIVVSPNGAEAISST